MRRNRRERTILVHLPICELRSSPCTSVLLIVRLQNASSRSWVTEEGEIFRKGNKLLGPEEMEGEFAGEELRIEVRTFSFNRSGTRPNSLQIGLTATGGSSRTTSSTCHSG